MTQLVGRTLKITNKSAGLCHSIFIADSFVCFRSPVSARQHEYGFALTGGGRLTALGGTDAAGGGVFRFFGLSCVAGLYTAGALAGWFSADGCGVLLVNVLRSSVSFWLTARSGWFAARGVVSLAR